MPVQEKAVTHSFRTNGWVWQGCVMLLSFEPPSFATLKIVYIGYFYMP